jgi:hypothetical protein
MQFPEEVVPEGAENAPKFSLGSRVSFLWSSSLLHGRLIAWPGVVKDTDTSLRCNIPKLVEIGDTINIALGNGLVEVITYEPGKTFNIKGNRLQIPRGAIPGKSIVWNGIKNGVGFRWYDILLDNCEHITRAFDAEVREYRVTDKIPDKGLLMGSLNLGSSKTQENPENGKKKSSNLSPLSKQFLESMANERN